MIVGRRDTIAAIATPAGPGGVGIVRISGPDAIVIAGVLLGRSPESFPDRQMLHGVAVEQDGSRLDDVLAVVMRAPRSFTGEDVAEIHGHGGTINMSRLLRAILRGGARHAEAGEFTRRAFENGQLDLTRAEGLLGVIEASSERAWRLAQTQLEGGLGREVMRLRDRATALLAEVEACIDFPEEGEEYASDAEFASRASQLAGDLSRLASTFSLGKALREGLEVAIAGPVNSGKSSLFNSLLGRERALVDDSPGTTRDFVEASTVWQGIPITLIDTAGDREAMDRVEQQGIEFGRKRAAEADLVVCVHSASDRVPTVPPARTEGQRQLHIITKGDLLPTMETEWLVTSARTGQGLDRLQTVILETACGTSADSDDGSVVTSERQKALLEAAAEAFRRAQQALASRAPTEVLAAEIHEGTSHLATITGERVGEEVLDHLFSQFCIGK